MELNFSPAKGPNPPGPTVGQLWEDTSSPSGSIMKYWDGDEWARMDGGGSVPDGHITESMLSPSVRKKLNEKTYTMAELKELKGVLGCNHS